MASLNQVVILGHLGADLQLAYTQGGTAVANLRVATHGTWKNREGEKEARTDWHQVVVWGQQAERCAEFLEKGRLVLVTGRLQTRQWTEDAGGTRSRTEIVAKSVEFVGRPKEEAA